MTPPEHEGWEGHGPIPGNARDKWKVWNVCIIEGFFFLMVSLSLIRLTPRAAVLFGGLWPSERRMTETMVAFVWRRANEGDPNLLQLRRQFGVLTGMPPTRPNSVHLHQIWSRVETANPSLLPSMHSMHSSYISSQIVKWDGNYTSIWNIMESSNTITNCFVSRLCGGWNV